MYRHPVLEVSRDSHLVGSRFVITAIDDSDTLDIEGLETAFRAEESALLEG